MSCCCAGCDARMIELVQAIDDLRRSLVIVLQEAQVSRVDSGGEDSYYWNNG
jgi:phage baseplate assembly protein W